MEESIVPFIQTPSEKIRRLCCIVCMRSSRLWYIFFCFFLIIGVACHLHSISHSKSIQPHKLSILFESPKEALPKLVHHG